MSGVKITTTWKERPGVCLEVAHGVSVPLKITFGLYKLLFGELPDE